MVTSLVMELSGHDIEVSSQGLTASPTEWNTECKSKNGMVKGYLFLSYIFNYCFNYTN